MYPHQAASTRRRVGGRRVSTAITNIAVTSQAATAYSSNRRENTRHKKQPQQQQQEAAACSLCAEENREDAARSIDPWPVRMQSHGRKVFTRSTKVSYDIIYTTGTDPSIYSERREGERTEEEQHKKIQSESIDTLAAYCISTI